MSLLEPPPAPSRPGVPFNSTLVVRPWHDPYVDVQGFDARSRYPELFWLPIVGPSALWLLRRLVDGFDDFPDGYELDLAEAAAALGLSTVKNRKSPFGRALQRIVLFDLGRPLPDGIAARVVVPPLPRHLRQRLPQHLAALHCSYERAAEHPAPGPLPADARTDAERLLAEGVEPAEAERLLQRRHGHPPLAAADGVRAALRARRAAA
jgi:hypothetical protein